MKKDSDNFRASAIQDIIKNLRGNNINVIIYEPTIEKEFFNGFKIEKDLEKFKENSSIILANREEKNLRC